MAPAIQFLPLDWAGLGGGFFARHGGLSAPPFDSLNVGYGVGDEAGLVDQNRRRLQDFLGLTALISTRQVHGDRILSLRAPAAGLGEHDGYDALITNQPGLGLMIQQADCQAVVIFDPRRRVVANIHSGWRGSVANIIAATVRRMAADFGTVPGEALAAISPSLGPCCAEFIHFRDTLPPAFHPFQVKAAHFDFWAISRMQLSEAGIPAARIQTAAICTRCDRNYFSYRREGITGRSATVVALC